MKTKILHSMIEKAIRTAFTYESYKQLVDNLYEEGKVTGHTQTEALLEYTKLNQRRMKRWEKTLKIPSEVEAIMKASTKKMIWLVISEGWCGDAAHILPVLHALSELNTKIELKIVLRDKHEDLMNHFLTNGGKSIPKLIVLNAESLNVMNTWGPRPSEAMQITTNYKAKNKILDAQFKEDLQRWYNKDKGQTTINNLIDLLA